MEQDTKFFKGIKNALLFMVIPWTLAICATILMSNLSFGLDSTIEKVLFFIAVLVLSTEVIFSLLVKRQREKGNRYVRDHRRV